MDLLPILGIAFGLAMDAFSVAVATGICLGKVTARQAFRLSFHFGFFQFAMPVLGWIAGSLVSEQIRSFDHWLAFGLLAFIGGKMIWEALQPEDGCVKGDPTRGVSLVMLSVATSLDAFAIGLSLALLEVPVLV
ncbi:MAG: manganese efflux pump MntP family protein, partial [Chloroflexota bacterium]